MRRRPIELWWIAAFSLIKSFAAFQLSLTATGTEHAIALTVGTASALSAGMLLCFSPIARWSSMVVLGFFTLNESIALLSGDQRWDATLLSVLVFSFGVWMMCYLSCASSARLFKSSAKDNAEKIGISLLLIDFLETAIGATAAAISYKLGASLFIATLIGLASLAIYDFFIEGIVRRLWVTRVSGGASGIPENDREIWRNACAALGRGDMKNSREALEKLTLETQRLPQSRLFQQVLDWHSLIEVAPQTGRDCLRRAACDHDWRPNENEQKRLADYSECALDEGIRRIIDERSSLIEGLVQAVREPASPFHAIADRMLSRITGETFAFNSAENWKTWWEVARNYWCGDAGGVALTARLIRMSPTAANALAKRIAGRAEEPTLRELTAQIVFLNAMQKAIREHGGIEPFIRQPQRMLLVPELSDAVGLLHCDSTLLRDLGMTLPTITRRLQVRVKLVDYIAELWRRFPHEIDGEMPWLLKTLTAKNFGVFRARARFQNWWPGARESFMRHDRAMSAGLAANASGDQDAEEKAFRSALNEQPRELSSRYNLALCLMRRKSHHEAAELLQELTRLEPKEPYWWIVLGVMHRTINKTSDAHAAFRRALELGAAAQRVALHIGLTFARDRHDAEAIKQLDRALGNNPTPSRIETLVSHLENEGLWQLAGHYREIAFQRGLSSPNDDDGDSTSSVDGEDVAA